MSTHTTIYRAELWQCLALRICPVHVQCHVGQELVCSMAAKWRGVIVSVHVHVIDYLYFIVARQMLLAHSTLVAGNT